MLEGLLDFSAAILSGGATGLLGTAVSGVIDHFQAKLKHRQEVELRRLDIELAKTESAGAERVAAIEAEGRRDEAEWEAMAASYQEAARRLTRPGEKGLMAFADFFRTITRPGLTWVHFWLVAAIYFLLSEPNLQKAIIATVLYVYTASSLWWFGQRQIEKRRTPKAGG